MAIRDVLLTLTTYPDPTPASAVQDAVSFAAAVGSHIAAVACEVHVQVPGTFLSGSIAGGLARHEAHESLNNAWTLITAFESAAEKAGVAHERILERCLTQQLPARLVEYARLRDLTIVPVPESYDQWHAETIIFESGRPTLVLPEIPRAGLLDLKTVMVAWDFSRAAARAIADAIPILEKAREVRIVTVTNEKVLDSKHSAEELAKNLSRHGIDVILDKVDAAGRSIGKVLQMQAASCAADLLVMGAFGHSRFREFVLGGATKSLLSKPPIPILFSH
jgi:nucleotide-binding universal stress UspA family protein